jgi:hypothetical protein
MDYLSVIHGALGGTAVTLIALRFLSKSLIEHLLARDLKKFELQMKQTLDAQIEQIKGAISYRNSLSVQRIDHLRTLWEAVHQYGGAVRSLAAGSGDPDEINSRIDTFKGAFSRAGIFLGHERFEVLYGEISEPFLDMLVKAKDDPAERERLFQDFEHRRWPYVLGQLELLLNEPTVPPAATNNLQMGRT